MPGCSNRLRLTTTTALRERFETSYVLPRVPAPTLLSGVIASTVATCSLKFLRIFLRQKLPIRFKNHNTVSTHMIHCSLG